MQLQLSLLASCTQGFFGERQFNCISCTKIPNWWQTCPESSQELWMVDVLNLFLLLLFINDRHETKVTKFRYKCNESFTKHLLFLEYILLYKKCLSLLVLVHRRTQNFMIIDLKKWSQTNLHLEHHDCWISYVTFDLHDQYRHLVPKCRISLLNIPGCEERGKRVVFAGYVSH